jgi:hypothetical protein
MRPEKPRSLVTAGVALILPYSKALAVENRLKFCNPSPVMVMSPYE